MGYGTASSSGGLPSPGSSARHSRLAPPGDGNGNTRSRLPHGRSERTRPRRRRSPYPPRPAISNSAQPSSRPDTRHKTLIVSSHLATGCARSQIWVQCRKQAMVRFGPPSERIAADGISANGCMGPFGLRRRDRSRPVGADRRPARPSARAPSRCAVRGGSTSSISTTASSPKLKACWRDAGMRVSASGPRSARCDVDADPQSEVARLRRVIRVADGGRALATSGSSRSSRRPCPRIRDDAYSPGCAARGCRRREGVVLLHENEKDIYGDTPERVLDIIESVGSPRSAWPGTARTSSRSGCRVRTTRDTGCCAPISTTCR